MTVYASPGTAAARALSVCKAVAGAKMSGAVHVASAYDGDDALAKVSAVESSSVPVAVTAQGAAVAGFATALRLAASGSSLVPNDALLRARCDQMIDIAGELAAASAAGDTATVRPLVSRAEIGLVGCATVGGVGATVGDIALAAALSDAEKTMSAAGAQPALMSRTAAYLRGWEATKEWSSA